MLKENLITSKGIKRIAIYFMIFSVVIILYVLITNLSHIGKIAIEIKYAPFEAAVFIDGENYPVNNTVNYLEPGSHHITVVMDGFKTLEQDVEITDETKYLYGSLETLDENDLELYQKYQADYSAVEQVGGKVATSEADKLNKKWPILENLPCIKNNYALGSYFDEQGNLVVTVRAVPAQIDNAINKLRSFENISLSDYNIVLQDFENVLDGKFVENSNSDPTEFLKNGYQNLDIPYRVNSGQQKDDYYYTTISVGKYAEYISVTYRVILQKSGASWKIVSTPYPLLTSYNTPSVDSSILNAVNQLSAPSTAIE